MSSSKSVIALALIAFFCPLCGPALSASDSEELMKLPPDTPVYSSREAAQAASLAKVGIDQEWRRSMDKGKSDLKLGKFAEAESAFRSALKTAKAKSEDNLMTILTLNALGAVLTDQKKFEAAEASYKEAEKLSTGGYPPSVVNMVKANIGNLYSLQGKTNLAQPYLESSAQFHLKKDGEESAVYATSLDNRAVVLKKQGRLDESEAMHKQALKIWEKVKGPNSVDYAVCLTNLAVLYLQQKRFLEADKFISQALDINEKVYTDSDPRLAESYFNAGVVRLQLGRESEAAKYFGKDIAVRSKAGGADSIALADELNNIGLSYAQCDKHHAAIENFEKSLAIREKRLPPSSLEVAKCVFNIAVRRIKLGQFDKAEQLLKRADAICEKSEPSMLQVAVLNAYSDVLSHTGNQKLAVQYALKAQKVKGNLPR